MSEKAFRLGLLVGRFQTLHKGHEQIILKAQQVCEEVAVLVGSSQESGTVKNPYSYELRCEMLSAVFGNTLRIFPLPDIGVGNNPAWGAYVLQQAENCLGARPDLIVSGKENRRQTWFDCPEGEGLGELVIPKTIDVSASKLREAMLRDDFEYWRSFMNPNLWSYYKTLRSQLLKAQENTHTDSI